MIKKLVMWTDIHFGARNNSDQHNLDNLDYIDWLIRIIDKEKPSHIAFLGDFFENRNAINVRTLNFALEGCRRLDSLNLPVLFLVGNHDLYHRANRDIFSTEMMTSFKNFQVISQPTRLSADWYAAPYLFRDEYPGLVGELNSSRYVIGHLEFRNFIVTGADRRLEHGPDPADFAGPRYIFSGHFHRRQAYRNIIYIGNTFPTNYGDAGDAERGCCVFDVEKDEVYFHNWDDAPLFFKTRLSRVLAGETYFPPRSRVRCLLDVDVSYSDVQLLRDEMVKTLGLREFSVEEDLQVKKEQLTEGLEIDEIDMSLLDGTVRRLILEGVQPSPTISPEELVRLYEELS